MAIAAKLEAQLETELKASGDPRVLGTGDGTFDTPKYLGGGPKFEKPER